MISSIIIEKVLLTALSTGGDFAEIFVEDRINSSINLLGGIIDKTVSGRDFGIGIRIFRKSQSFYAYTNDISEKNLIITAKKAAAAIFDSSHKNIVINLNKIDIKNMHFIELYPETVSKTRKIEIMKRVYNAAKDYSSLINQVKVNYLDYDQKILIANSQGLLIEDRRIRSRLSVNSIALKDGEMQSGYYGPGASKGFELFENMDVEWYGKESSRIAVEMINADYAPSGKTDVIIDNGFGGVIFHEACGHGLEATSVAKGNSVFADKLGQKIASEIVTAVDDGTISNNWGSSNIDDEGTKTRKNILIENGILKNFMVDKLNGIKMNLESTGSGRRQSYKYSPTSRMTNTYIANGKSTPEEIIEKTENGIYAKNMGGGSVNPATGEFNFSVMEGYIVKNGKIKKPIRGATIIGTGMEVLKKIDMVGNNLKFGQGMCGSTSGSVPTNVGQPMIRVSDILVGGRDGGNNG